MHELMERKAFGRLANISSLIIYFHQHPPRMGTRGKILWEAALGGGGSGSQRLGSGSSPGYVFDYFIFSSVFLYYFWIVSLSFSSGKFKNQGEQRWICWVLDSTSSKKHNIAPVTNCPRGSKGLMTTSTGWKAALVVIRPQRTSLYMTMLTALADFIILSEWFRLKLFSNSSFNLFK